MYQHPVLVQALTKDRAAELRHRADANARVQRDKRRSKLVAAARHGTGWLLIDIGLRLAMPPARTNNPVAPGQR